MSQEGRAAAASLAPKLRAYGPMGLVSSAEPKAVDTARILGERLGLSAVQDADLGEQRNETGPFEAREVFEAKVGRMFARPEELVLGEETGATARARFDAAVARQRDAHPRGGLILVAHGRVIALWASRRLRLEPMVLWRRLGLAGALVIQDESYAILDP